MKYVAVWLFVCVVLFPSVNSVVASSMADDALCEYAMKLYREGDVAEAIEQLYKALLVNPQNFSAKNYLQQILAEQQTAGTEASLQVRRTLESFNTQLSQSEEERRNCQVRLGSAAEATSFQEGQLQDLEQQLAQQQKLFSEKEEALLNTKGKVSQLDARVAQLQEEKQFYQQHVASLREACAAKDRELSELNQKLFSHKDLLGQKDNEYVTTLQNEQCKVTQLSSQLVQLTQEKAICEKKLDALENTRGESTQRLQQQLEGRKEQAEECKAQLLQKQSMIDALQLQKQKLLEKNRQSQQQQVADIERLMRILEEAGNP